MLSLNYINGFLHLVVVALLIGAIAISVRDTENFAKKSDVNGDNQEQATFSITMLMSSLFIVTIIFSLICFSLIYKSKGKDLRDNLAYLFSNMIILAFSITVLLPAFAIAIDIGTGEVIVFVLLGNLLALFLSFSSVVRYLNIKTEKKMEKEIKRKHN